MGPIAHFILRPLAPPEERAIGLILDVLAVIADELYALAVEKIGGAPHPEQITVRLDDLTAAISEVSLDGEVSTEHRETSERKEGHSLKVQVDLAKDKQGGGIGVGADSSQATTSEIKSGAKGIPRRHINFGKVQATFDSLIQVLGGPQIWLLVDEWSEVPNDLQPFLADLFRRTVLPLKNVVVKIAAIEHRTTLFLPKDKGEYLGLELGADIAADVNLDDFLVFDNNQERSVAFFKQLLYSHYRAATPAPSITSADELIRIVFTQVPVFEELVRAAEGVPRDAINLAAKLGSKSFGRAAAAADIRGVARDWYLQDKASIFKSWPELDQLMSSIIEEVIGQRRARAFLFPSNAKNEHLDRLFDSRIVHVLKRNISSKEDAGKRYTVYKIDYGCYVDLINTKKAPEGLFEAMLVQGSEDAWTEVPLDDYRSIRRAILAPEDVQAFLDKFSE